MTVDIKYSEHVG